jgi:solute carrier family 25 (mitochondrial carnitine/acylcarnitine transporter), member 20/29
MKDTDSNAPKSTITGVKRLFRGIGLSSSRSVIVHGLLWTFYDIVANLVDSLPASAEMEI